MTQYNLPVFASPTPGPTFLKDNLEPWRDAVHSMHAGATRPDYVVPQMMWIDTSTTPWVLKVFQGSDDIVLGSLDPVTLNFTPSAVDGSTITGLTASGVGYGSDNVEIALNGLTSDVNDINNALPTLNTVKLNAVVQTTSGSFIDVTGIPTGVKRVILKLQSVGITGTDSVALLIGDASAFTSVVAGGISSHGATGVTANNFTSSFTLCNNTASGQRLTGIVILEKHSTENNGWDFTFVGSRDETARTFMAAGSALLSGSLSRLRLAQTGSSTFNAGNISISWEF